MSGSTPDPKEFEEIISDPKDRSRRSALKKLLIAAGVLTGYQVLPKQWTRPIIEQVVLPAHAQTSGVSLTDPCESVTLVSGNQSSPTVIIKVQGYIIPAIAGVTINISATVSGGTGGTTPTSTTTNNNGKYSINMVVHGGPGITAVSVEITAVGAIGSANCSVSVPDADSAGSSDGDEEEYECGSDDYLVPVTNDSSYPEITIDPNPWPYNSTVAIRNPADSGKYLFFTVTLTKCDGSTEIVTRELCQGPGGGIWIYRGFDKYPNVRSASVNAVECGE